MICDPGAVIIPELIKNNYKVTSLPGACAVTTFLSQIPRKDDSFTFIGFIPRTENQIKHIVTKYASQNIVFYEAPERILKTLQVISCCRNDVRVAIGRELSKLFEEVVIGDIEDIINHFKSGIKGEIVCMIYAENNTECLDIKTKVKILKSKGYRDKDISIILSALFDCNKNDVYQVSISLDK